MENQLVTISEENVQCRFQLENNSYVLICFNENPTEEDEMYFAVEEKLDDGMVIVRNIDSDEEYQRVVEKFESLMSEIGDEDKDEIL